MRYYAKKAAYNVYYCHNTETEETLEITKYDGNFSSENLEDFKRFCSRSYEITESNKEEFDAVMKIYAERLNTFNHE